MGKENAKKAFVGHYCKVVWQNGFILKGKILEADNDGIILETKEKKSFVTYPVIGNIIMLDEVKQ